MHQHGHRHAIGHDSKDRDAVQRERSCRCWWRARGRFGCACERRHGCSDGSDLVRGGWGQAWVGYLGGKGRVVLVIGGERGGARAMAEESTALKLDDNYIVVRKAHHETRGKDEVAGHHDKSTDTGVVTLEAVLIY